MGEYKHILLLVNPMKDPDFKIAGDIVNRLSAHKDVNVYVCDEDDAEKIGCRYAECIPDELDLVIVMGGDGSVLDASIIALDKDVPLLGINLGHLGYLAELDIHEIALLDGLFDGSALIKERITLELAVERNDDVIEKCDRLGANEITLLHVEEFGLSDLTVTDETGNRIRYHGDGLIIATPTGSTGYSFSAGGPILAPELQNICITPICPHSFFNRSMIIGADTEVHVTNTTHHAERVGVSVDGRKAYILEAGDSVRVCASEKKLKTISFCAHPTFNTLRQKMEQAELKD